MILLGLAGSAGSGKSAVAEYLVKRYGFLRFSFSDALYREVVAAFRLPDESLLRDRAMKEVPTERLSLVRCENDAFVELVSGPDQIPETVQYLSSFNQPLSPRQILQWWGTQFRRAQHPDYWILKAQQWITAIRRSVAFPEQKHQFFVNDSVRFNNEREWVHQPIYDGNIWHLHRDAATPVHAHESETPLPVLDGEREIWNNSSLQNLYQAVDLLLSTAAPSVRCEPMEKAITEEQV